MSFLEENKYFLQSFFSGLRNLDIDSKKAEYESYRRTLRTKMSEFYQKIDADDNAQTLLQKDHFFEDIIDCIEHNDADEAQTLLKKDRFYKDLIDCIGDYDFDYILMNLFLDKDFIKLIPSFFTNEKFKALLEQSKTTLGFFIKGFNKKMTGSLAVDIEFSTYLKSAFYDFISTDNNTWEEKDYKTRSSINHKYAQYLIQSVTLESPNWQSIIHNHLLFIKAYNHLDYFNKDKTLKSILFINEMINHYNLEKQTHDVKLVQLVDKIVGEIHSNSFVNYTKTPVCMSESMAHNISTGLANRIKEFNALLDIRSAVNNTDQSSYYDLHKLSEGISSIELNKYLNEKVSTGQFISESDIQNIEEDSRSNSDMNKGKDLIFRKFYVFEKIELRQ